MMKQITRPSFDLEIDCWNNDIPYVIGIDEVGRGAFAGPIVAAGVIYKPYFKSEFLRRINDSKLLKPKVREELSEYIKDNSTWVIEEVSLDFINKFGIGKANMEVFNKVLKKLAINSSFVLVDGFKLNIPNHRAVVHGDRLSISIASASIIAKVYRDNLMMGLSSKYPEYHFQLNKGYGTKNHRNAIQKHGLCNIHRTSFNLNKFIATN